MSMLVIPGLDGAPDRVYVPFTCGHSERCVNNGVCKRKNGGCQYWECTVLPCFVPRPELVRVVDVALPSKSMR